MDREAGSDGYASQAPSRATSPQTLLHRDNSKNTQTSSFARPNGLEDDGSGNEGAQPLPKPARYRPRTFPYQRYLPYPHQDKALKNLATCIKCLYVAVAAGDFVPGATHWTREIRGWIQLKFDLPRQDRVRLAKLYYELALAPGMESSASERFASMFMTLTKRKHYLRVGEDLYLDWRPLYREIKPSVLPSETGSVVVMTGTHAKKSSRTLLKMCAFAQLYFDPSEIPAMLEEMLPYFSTSSPENAFAVVGLLNLLLPTSSTADAKWQPQYFFPTFFHVWSLVNRSKTFDLHFVDLFSRFARDCLSSKHVSFSEFGMFTGEQASSIFTAVLRLLEIPVSQVTSPYSTTVDMYQGLASLLERDQRKHPIAHHIARWIVMSLSPACLDKPDSMLSKLEGLVQAIETFYHPSNSGAWTKTLSQLVFYLADFFVMRWNRERSGEMTVPEDRKLNPAIRKRFVLCLRDVTFMGIFAKSGTAMSYSLSSLSSLALLEPKSILPGALQRIYPSLRGLVEVHRTTSSIRALHELTRVMSRTKGFRCHVTSLLGLALPGIDANDLDKTMHTLSYLQSVFYAIPMCDLTRSKKNSGNEDEPLDGMLAAQWVTAQIDRLEMEGVDIEIDYDAEISDEEEEMILRSSTADLQSFLSQFLDRVFNLLRNLPDAARVKSGSPEENITNTLPAAFTPLFASMSPELYDFALKKIADFVSKQVVYQARDAMAFICSVLCKANPEKALAELVPILTQSIRTEIDENDAGSSRTTGSEVLPRDKALVWNMSLLSMVIVHVGGAVVEHRDSLLDISRFMVQKCKGIPSTHASNFVHHLLLTLTMTYTTDYSLYEDDDVKSGVGPAQWGSIPDPQQLNIKWHYATSNEIEFAIELFKLLAEAELDRLNELTGGISPIKRDGAGKDWSDEVSRSLVLLRLVLSGISCLFNPRHDQPEEKDDVTMIDRDDEVVDAASSADLEMGATEDEDVKPTFQYPTGYQLDTNEPRYQEIHAIRARIGQTLHKVHEFLTKEQQDDVMSFNALYMAYRAWFTDLGIERSAHVLDRVQRLLVADIGPYKISGTRKEYPRPLLVRRANVYHLQRLRLNASPRHKTELDVILLGDLVQSSVSLYTEIRKTAQTANEATMKVIIGARPVLIPPLLEHLEVAIRENDFQRIKGALYSLLFGALSKPVGRDWRFTPSLLRSYVNVMDVDKVSIQRLSSGAALQVMEMTRQQARMVILDKDIIKGIAKSSDEDFVDNPSIQATIEKRSQVIKDRQDFVKTRRAQLSNELAEIAKRSHWRKESRTASLVIGLSLRFDDIASTTMVDLVVKRAVDAHPSLRTIYSSALIGLFTYIDMRAIANHEYENLLLDRKKIPGFVKSKPDREDPQWTAKFLKNYSEADATLYVDNDYPGWLVWGDTVPSFRAATDSILEYDDVEKTIRSRIGAQLDKSWFATYFAYMKQEPRDQSADRFRMTNVIALTSAFNLIFCQVAVTTFTDLKELTLAVFGDGSDKHQHRATAEIMAGLLNAIVPFDVTRKDEVWSFVFPIVRSVFESGITPENASYWSTFLDVVLQNRDPRRSWPLVDWLAGFRLDMSSNAAFKESSKITLLEHCILDVGWHFQLDQPIVEDFLAHLDHPYKGVREVMGQTLACIYRARYHESHKDVASFVEGQQATSSIGSKPYQPTDDHAATVKEVFSRIEKWRQERPPGQQTASPYTSGSKTTLAWLDSVLYSFECTQLIPFFPDHFLEAVLHMMDIKEDPELQSQAYAVFRHLGNIPYRAGEEGPFVDALIRIGRTATSWHQRLRIMINIQAIYFRHLFLMPASRQQALFDCVSAMLEDTQLEVRVGAGATLSGMIRCSPVALRQSVINNLTNRLTGMLEKNPLRRKNPGTPTPEQSKLVITRHAAVLGLGALVQAFPYSSPPPTWIPAILATLATKAAGDPGVIGKSAKSIVSDFKKTRQDTWHIDIKAFQPEQLEDLEGVLWKSYFA